MITFDISPIEQHIFEKASQLSGLQINDFIRQQAYQSAIAMIKNEDGIYLTQAEWDRAVAILENPPEPNAKMQALIKKGEQLVKS